VFEVMAIKGADTLRRRAVAAPSEKKARSGEADRALSRW
jgi:hypothetical protein